jgi:hypothetical protein
MVETIASVIEVNMSLFDVVHCNNSLFGVHSGETHQTKDLHWLGGALDQYETTPSGRLEFLEYITVDRGNPNAEELDSLAGAMTIAFTGGRRDLNYHGWLYLSCFGRAKFTDGMLVAFEPEASESDRSGEIPSASQSDKESGAAKSDPVPESRTEIDVNRD